MGREMDRQRFQGLCLEGQEGKNYMHTFDNMSASMREQLRYSPYNLCAACCVSGRKDQAEMARMIRTHDPEDCRALLPQGKNLLLKYRLKI